MCLRGIFKVLCIIIDIYFLSNLNETFPELIGAGLDDAGSPKPPNMINKPGITASGWSNIS